MRQQLPQMYLWAYQIVGGAYNEADGVARSKDDAVRAIASDIRSNFPRSPKPELYVAGERSDQTLFEIRGGTEYVGMASVTPVTPKDYLQMSLAAFSGDAAEANPRARNNWAFLIPIAQQLGIAIATSLGAATWGKLSAMSVDDRAAWLEKAAVVSGAVSTAGVSLLINKLVNKIPLMAGGKKKMFLALSKTMGDPSVQAAAVAAGKAALAAKGAKGATAVVAKANRKARRTPSRARNNAALELTWDKRDRKPKDWFGPAYYSTYDESKLFHSQREASAFDTEEDNRRESLRTAEREAFEQKLVEDRRQAWLRELRERADREQDEREREYARSAYDYKLDFLKSSVASCENIAALEKRRVEKWDREGGPKTAEDRRNYATFSKMVKDADAEVAEYKAKVVALLSKGRPNPASRGDLNDWAVLSILQAEGPLSLDKIVWHNGAMSRLDTMTSLKRLLERGEVSGDNGVYRETRGIHRELSRRSR